ncbi:MAG: PorV/PorQ family protein [Candidatus Eisenbacteria bacterium]|nr:PorV/PorQ family protein [Candidatus Latescibacterota bacterium]MBD3301879.1 PorV/PorQ family protein [Candidatus Eisenbacteria bacterium]
MTWGYLPDDPVGGSARFPNVEEDSPLKLPKILTRSAVCAGLLFVLPSAAWSQGTSGAASLNITPGARADAMGRANVALSQDATSNWWNPSALAAVDERIFSLMHTQLVPDLADDVYYEYLGYAQHVEGWGGVGVGLIFLTYGKSIATDEEGRERGTFSSYELSPSISLGTEVAPGLSAGITLKYVYVSLAPKEFTLDGEAGTGDTFAADLGALYHLEVIPEMPLHLGVNVQNLGPDISFIDEDQSDPIGRNLKTGIGVESLHFDPFRMAFEFDVNKSLIYSDEKPIYNVGFEAFFRSTGEFAGALRAGYIHDKDGDIIDPTFGFGIGLGGLAFDYASVPQAEGLDRVSKFSLNYRF